MKYRLLGIVMAALLLCGVRGLMSCPAQAASGPQTVSAPAGPVVTQPPAQTEAPRVTSGLGLIGVVLPTLDTEYYAALLDSIRSNAQQNRFEILACAADQMGGMQKALETVLDGGVRSVIIDSPDLGDEGVSALAARCLARGIPCVMILDNEESDKTDTFNGSVAVIPLSSKIVGFYMMNSIPSILGHTLDIMDGKLLIVAGDPDSPVTKANVAGLRFDADGTILKRKHIRILKTLFVTSKKPLDQLVASALKKDRDIDTVICIERSFSFELLGLLQSLGFRGNLLCWVDETAIGQMEAAIDDLRLVYVYWPITRIAKESFTAAMTQALFGQSFNGNCYLNCSFSKTAE